MTPVVVFYADICPLCHNALNYLRGRDITVDAREVFWDAKADAFIDGENTREMYRRCGKRVDFVPQIFIGNTHIPGWNR
jgi:glutaredoxin